MTIISLNFRQAAYASETGRVPIALLTITHPDMAETLYISADPTMRITASSVGVIYGTLSRGNNYVFLPMTLKLPDDDDSGGGQMTLELDNIGRELTQAIRAVATPAKVKIEFVMDNALDTVDVLFPEYMISTISYNAATISMALVVDDLTREPFPGLMATPGTTPGIFA
jgi:hypothetical protein